MIDNDLFEALFKNDPIKIEVDADKIQESVLKYGRNKSGSESLFNIKEMKIPELFDPYKYMELYNPNLTSKIMESKYSKEIKSVKEYYAKSGIEPTGTDMVAGVLNLLGEAGTTTPDNKIAEDVAEACGYQNIPMEMLDTAINIYKGVNSKFKESKDLEKEIKKVAKDKEKDDKKVVKEDAFMGAGSGQQGNGDLTVIARSISDQQTANTIAQSKGGKVVTDVEDPKKFMVVLQKDMQESELSKEIAVNDAKIKEAKDPIDAHIYALKSTVANLANYKASDDIDQAIEYADIAVKQTTELVHNLEKAKTTKGMVDDVKNQKMPPNPTLHNKVQQDIPDESMAPNGPQNMPDQVQAESKLKESTSDLKLVSVVEMAEYLSDLSDKIEEAHIGFKKLTKKLAGKKGVTNAKGLAAYIGRKKYGAKQFSKMANESKELKEIFCIGISTPQSMGAVGAPEGGVKEEKIDEENKFCPKCGKELKECGCNGMIKEPVKEMKLNTVFNPYNYLDLIDPQLRDKVMESKSEKKVQEAIEKVYLCLQLESRKDLTDKEKSFVENVKKESYTDEERIWIKESFSATFGKMLKKKDSKLSKVTKGKDFGKITKI